MFVTTAEFEEEHPSPSLVELGLTSWCAVQITCSCPVWFVVSYALPDAANEVCGSILVASEQLLEHMLSEDSPLRALAVSAMTVDTERLSWRQHVVASVWTKEDPSGEFASGGMVLSLENDATLRTFTLAEAKPSCKGTRLFNRRCA